MGGVDISTVIAFLVILALVSVAVSVKSDGGPTGDPVAPAPEPKEK